MPRSNKSKHQKKIVEGDRYVDRISSLPKDVIECILNFMTTLDAARTCVLSSRWRYAWADHPSLLLDQHFLDDIQQGRLPNELVIDYPNIVDKILLHRDGHIRKLFIYVSPALSSMPHTNIDLWLSSLSRRGLKDLQLQNAGRYPYKLPCSVFPSSELVELNLSFCIIRSGLCTNIQTLLLRLVTFDSNVVLTTPLLTVLELDTCRGTLHFDISAPKLKHLSLCDNDDLNLKPFLTCTGIEYAFLYARGTTATCVKGCESVCLVKLLAAWPRISELVVNGFYFEYLATGIIPPKLDQLNLRSFSIHDVYLDLELMPRILWILKNSPLLKTFEISTNNKGLAKRGCKVNGPARCILDFRMDQLHTVVMKNFTATSNELVLAKILLHRAPFLEKIIVEEIVELDPEEYTSILKNLLPLQQAFPKSRIVYRPCYKKESEREGVLLELKVILFTLVVEGKAVRDILTRGGKCPST